MTAHGGTITGPGCPTVLIGGMPAACMGDMHVCPMATPGTPPIPHVGGPITLGSTGVLIGKKPAARMGDMAVCVGPPSSIVLGCMTVLIGEAGGGGGGGGGAGAGAGGGSAAAGAVTSAAIAGQAPQTSQAAESFLDVAFVNKANLPIGGVPYNLTCPDSSKSNGVLGGQIKRTGVPQPQSGERRRRRHARSHRPYSSGSILGLHGKIRRGRHRRPTAQRRRGLLQIGLGSRGSQARTNDVPRRRAGFRSAAPLLASIAPQPGHDRAGRDGASSRNHCKDDWDRRSRASPTRPPGICASAGRRSGQAAPLPLSINWTRRSRRSRPKSRRFAGRASCENSPSRRWSMFSR